MASDLNRYKDAIGEQRDEGDETPEPKPQSLAEIDPRLGTLEYERAQGHFRTDGEDIPEPSE